MKLLQVTNWFYLLTLTVFFVLAGVVLYFFVNRCLTRDIDEQLNHKKFKLLHAMSGTDSLSVELLPFHDNISIKRSDSPFSENVEFFDQENFGKDKHRHHSRMDPSQEVVFKFDKEKRERVPYRIIHFQAATRLYSYDVHIWQSEVEAEDLIESIFFSLMAVFGVSCIILFVANYFFTKRLLSPLIATISTIRAWDIKGGDKSVVLEATPIKEFNELNASLERMITQLISDYHRMKEFTENASHELQTPVAIIRTKLEMLLQSEALDDDQAKLINQALENTVRLSKLNQTLLLLSKIESNQFGLMERVNFSEVFVKSISHVEDLIAFRGLHLDMVVEEEFTWSMNPGLADVLVSNMLSNAINHNLAGGDVCVVVKKDRFEVCNSGAVPTIPTEQMFARFKKGNHSSSNVGLGLALVKEIVENHSASVSYSFENGLHKVTVVGTSI